MLAAFTPALVSAPVTVATHGVPVTLHCLVRRSLSAAGSAAGSILYLRLTGVPMSSSHDVGVRQKILPGPTSVAAGRACAHAGVALAMMPTMASHPAAPQTFILTILEPPCSESQVPPPAASPASRGSTAQAQEPFSPG